MPKFYFYCVIVHWERVYDSIYCILNYSIRFLNLTDLVLYIILYRVNYLSDIISSTDVTSNTVKPQSNRSPTYHSTVALVDRKCRHQTDL